MQPPDLGPIILEHVRSGLNRPAHDNNFIIIDRFDRPISWDFTVQNVPSHGQYGFRIIFFDNKLCITIPPSISIGYHVTRVIEFNPQLLSSPSRSLHRTGFNGLSHDWLYDAHDPTSFSRVIEDSIMIMKIMESLRLYRLEYYDRHTGMLTTQEEETMISSVAASVGP